MRRRSSRGRLWRLDIWILLGTEVVLGRVHGIRDCFIVLPWRAGLPTGSAKLHWFEVVLGRVLSSLPSLKIPSSCLVGLED